ncbi:hypothetical protein GGE12_005765 [Rhizobium mongolense]|uniref:Uncharacterized protein n=1 Tax=Rhizobium mongolense TaxID=57676 RepID=A0A7W6WH47_9HYPH|nr:hypothetical protein [Rhizobium mongolense]
MRFSMRLCNVLQGESCATSGSSYATFAREDSAPVYRPAITFLAWAQWRDPRLAVR